LTCAELDAGCDEVEFYIEGLIARDQPGIIGAPPKCLKTSLATEFAVSMSTGTPCLGHDVAERRRVLFMSGESGEAASRICFRSVAESKGWNLSDIDNLFWSDSIPQFGTAAHERAIRAHLRRYKPDVLIVDPAYRAVGNAKAESVFEMGGLLGSINDTCRQEGPR
jgi:RecA-family ATPase